MNENLEKWRSIGVIKPKTRKVNTKDAALAADMAAYRRLRAEGHQPLTLTGAAELEKRAEHAVELEMGKIFDKKDMPAVREGVEVSEQLGLRGPFSR